MQIDKKKYIIYDFFVTKGSFFALIDRTTKGDRSMHSIEAIYKEHSKMVYRYLLSLTGNSDLAEELTQGKDGNSEKNA